MIPLSLSMSLESMTRSSTSWFARNTPLCFNNWSTRVVLPWSTWAMIAIFLISSRLIFIINPLSSSITVLSPIISRPVLHSHLTLYTLHFLIFALPTQNYSIHEIKMQYIIFQNSGQICLFCVFFSIQSAVSFLSPIQNVRTPVYTGLLRHSRISLISPSRHNFCMCRLMPRPAVKTESLPY